MSATPRRSRPPSARRSRGSRRPIRSRSRTRCSRRGSRSRCSTTRAARALGIGLDDVPRRDRRDARADDADRGAQPARLVPRRARRRPRSSTRAPTTAWSATRTRSTWSSVMDVDMAGALVLATHERADALGVPLDRRVYPRGWCYARDPVLVAEHPDLARSPAMAAASAEALRDRGRRRSTTSRSSTSTRASRARCTSRATRSACAPTIRAALTVTGGLPYHGGPASGYLTHSIAAMVERLRAEPDAAGLVSGVGMHMTKHVFGVYTRGARRRSSRPTRRACRPRSTEPARSRSSRSTTATPRSARTRWCTAATASPEWALLVCDLPDGRAHVRPGTRSASLRRRGDDRARRTHGDAEAADRRRPDGQSKSEPRHLVRRTTTAPDARRSRTRPRARDPQSSTRRERSELAGSGEPRQVRVAANARATRVRRARPERVIDRGAASSLGCAGTIHCDGGHTRRHARCRYPMPAQCQLWGNT